MGKVNYHSVLEPEVTYHIFNHAIGSDNLFSNDDNYRYFLKRYAHFISPIAKTMAYCLLPNHFHLAVTIRSKDEILKHHSTLLSEEGVVNQKIESIESFLTKQFGKLFSSYTQSYNKVSSRKGALFIQQYKRVRVTSEKQLSNLIHYIHYNPVRHGIAANVKDWSYSSYHTYLLSKPTLLEREEGLMLYGGIKGFIATHSIRPILISEIDMDF